MSVPLYINGISSVIPERERERERKREDVVMQCGEDYGLNHKTDRPNALK